MKSFRRYIIPLLLCTVLSAQINSVVSLSSPDNFQKSLLTEADGGESNTTGMEKSKGRAVLFSLLVPGTGEMYLGHKKMGAILISSEVALWSSYFLLNWISDIKEDDFMLYATSHAGVNSANKPHQYFVNIENYETLAAYNQAVLQRRSTRDLYPEDGTYDWNWDAEESRKKYKRMRVSSDRYKNAGLFMIGGVVLNHIVSAIDVLRIANADQQNEASKSTHLYFSGMPEGGMKVSLLKQL
jgi:hypothetical protein